MQEIPRHPFPACTGDDQPRCQPACTPTEPMTDGIGLADDTPIPTPEGWTPLGDIAAGDLVFDHQGRVCTVTDVLHQGVVPVYEVRFDDGATLLTGGRHEWMTTSDLYREKMRDGTRWLALWADPALWGITTLDIGKSLIRDVGGCLKANHSIPTAGPLVLPERDLPIDPYLLGLWLGDGSSDAPQIHCHWMDEHHYFMRARAAGENWTLLRKKGNVETYGLAHGGSPVFVSRLRMLGVLGSKHVPDLYLRAGMEQRLALLRGLMDSDGHVDDRGWAEYTSISEPLARGVLELALSLGQKATAHVGKATIDGRFISDKHRIFFAPTIQVQELPRKAARLGPALLYREQATFPRPRQRYIKSVTPTGCRPTTQVAVDSPYHLLLAGRAMIPTLTCPTSR